MSSTEEDAVGTAILTQVRSLQNNAVRLGDENGTSLILGIDGFIMQTDKSAVILAYEPLDNQLYIKNTRIGETVDFLVEGRILNSHNVDAFKEISRLQTEIVHLKKQNATLEAKVEEIYNAPGMPGYIMAKDDFYDLVDSSQKDDIVLRRKSV